MGRALHLASLCLLLGCTGGADEAEGDGTMSSGEGSSSSMTSATATSIMTSAASTSQDTGTSGAVPVVPLEGFWRWNSYGDVIDGCTLYGDAWDTGVTLVQEASEVGFSMQPPLLSPASCSLAGSEFECQPLPVSFPEPAQMFLNFAGTLTSPTEGSLAFRTTAACEGTECAAIEGMQDFTFPCESTALTQGFLMADVELTDEGCDAEATLASQFPSDQSAITVVNETAEAVKLWGINEDGVRVGGAVVEAGEFREQISSVSIINVITNAQDECRGVYVTTVDHGIMTIQ